MFFHAFREKKCCSINNEHLEIEFHGTRPKPPYRRQGLAGGVVEPGYSSSRYILNVSHRDSAALLGFDTDNFEKGKLAVLTAKEAFQL